MQNGKHFHLGLGVVEPRQAIRSSGSRATIGSTLDPECSEYTVKSRLFASGKRSKVLESGFGLGLRGNCSTGAELYLRAGFCVCPVYVNVDILV